MQPDGKTRVRLDHPGPGLIGFQSDFLTMTRGTGVMSHVFDDYGPMKPEIAERRNGVLVSAEDGESVAYALWRLQERGRMFVDPGVDGSPKSAEDLRPWASRTRKCFVTTSRADSCRESWRGWQLPATVRAPAPPQLSRRPASLTPRADRAHPHLGRLQKFHPDPARLAGG